MPEHDKWDKKEIDGIVFYSFHENLNTPEIYKPELETRFKEIIEDYNPDVVHIFGTEFPHSLAMIKAYDKPSQTLLGDGIIAFSTVPLAIASIIGTLFCVIAFIGILFILIRSLFWQDPTSGWPSMVCIIMLVSGVQLFCLGVVGQYLSKTYLEVKKRPLYLVKEDI